MPLRAAFAAFLVLSLAAANQQLVARAYNNPELIMVVGQNENLTKSALSYNVEDVMRPLNWTVAGGQVQKLATELSNFAAERYGADLAFGPHPPVVIDPTPGASNVYGNFNGKSLLTCLLASGKYHVMSATFSSLLFPYIIDASKPPLINLTECVNTFDLSPIGLPFVGGNYAGTFAAENGGTAPIRPSDNLALGIYVVDVPLASGRSARLKVYMRTAFPDRTEPVLEGRSTERGQLCIEPNELLPEGATGVSVMRVDAFASQPNAQGLYPTSTTAVWTFEKTPAVPSLYSFVPRIYPGNTRKTCFASGL